MIISIYSLQSFFNQFIPIILILVLLNMFFWSYKFFKSPKEKESLHAWYKRKFIRSIIFIILVPFLWGIVGFLGNVLSVSQGGSAPTLSFASSAISVPTFRPNEGMGYYPPAQTTPTITDNRNFEKITYSGSIKTRDVEKDAKKVKLLIKASSGRIDYSNTSKTYASFNFVIPKKEFDSFEDEMQTIVTAKLYSQEISTQNRLNEKQAIEQNKNSAKDSISRLNAQQQKVKDEYTQSSNALKEQIKKQTADLYLIQNSISLATTSDTLAVYKQKLGVTTDSINRMNSTLTSLTITFQRDMSTLGVSLAQQDNVLNDLVKATDSFLDEVETVQGSVYIQHVSYLELFTIYSPISPAWIIILLILTSIIHTTVANHKKEKELMAL